MLYYFLVAGVLWGIVLTNPEKNEVARVFWIKYEEFEIEAHIKHVIQKLKLALVK